MKDQFIPAILWADSVVLYAEEIKEQMMQDEESARKAAQQMLKAARIVKNILIELKEICNE